MHTTERMIFRLRHLAAKGPDWPREQDQAMEALGQKHGALAVVAANGRGDVLVYAMDDAPGLVNVEPAHVYAIELDGRTYRPMPGAYAHVPKPDRYRAMEPLVSARA